LRGDDSALNIDDLFAPLAGQLRLGGCGPFIINLMVSNTQIAAPPKTLGGVHQALVYQIQRTEDGRVRYRLRLGPFASEDEADAALTNVRQIYPGALTATAGRDDAREIASLQAKAGPSQAPAEKRIEVPTPPIPAAVNPSVAPISAAAPTAPATAQPPPVASRPPHVAVRPAPKEAVPPTPARARPESVAPAAAIPAAAPKPAATASPSPNAAAQLENAERRIELRVDSSPGIEATQTLRPLTALEQQDETGSRWFVIQLALGDQAFDPDSLPHLDIFSLYRLYSVAGLDHGQLKYALRLGFFSEKIAAITIAHYLGAHYDKPKVVRVSIAERERFSDQLVQARKDVGATGRHVAIEITDELVVRENRIRSLSAGAGTSTQNVAQRTIPNRRG
jgi:hypothetical protein